MGELSNIEIIGIIVLIFIFGGLLWRIAKSLLKFFVIAVLIVGAIWYFNPEFVKEQIGEKDFEKFDKKIKNVVEEINEVDVDSTITAIGDSVETLVN